MDDLKDRRGYCQLKEEALDRTMCRNVLEEALELSFDRLLITMMMIRKLVAFRQDGSIVLCTAQIPNYFLRINDSEIKTFISH